MPELVVPNVGMHEAWLAARREWGPGLHEDGFGIGADDDVESTAGFQAWVGQRLAAERDGLASCRWVVEDGRVVGGIALRHNRGDGSPPERRELLDRIGHIGYGIVPSARGRGLATWALREMLVLASGLGMPEVTAVCLGDNPASRRTIERCGGVLSEERSTDHGTVLRYLISVPPGREAD